MTEIPKFRITPVTQMQNWRLFRCSVLRVIEEGDEDPQYDRFMIYASTAESCQRNAQDVLDALNQP